MRWRANSTVSACSTAAFCAAIASARCCLSGERGGAGGGNVGAGGAGWPRRLRMCCSDIPELLDAGGVGEQAIERPRRSVEGHVHGAAPVLALLPPAIPL